MMGLAIDKRHYVSVAPLDKSDLDYTPASGKTLTVLIMGGNASSAETTKSEVIWDPGGAQQEVLFTTYGDAEVSVGREFVGDGVRKIRIRLTNDQLVARTLGCYWSGAVA